MEWYCSIYYWKNSVYIQIWKVQTRVVQGSTVCLSAVCVCSVASDSLRPHGLQPSRLLCSWDSPGKNVGVGCHFLFQGIFPNHGWTRVSCIDRRVLYVCYCKESFREWFEVNPESNQLCLPTYFSPLLSSPHEPPSVLSTTICTWSASPQYDYVNHVICAQHWIF